MPQFAATIRIDRLDLHQITDAIRTQKERIEEREQVKLRELRRVRTSCFGEDVLKVVWQTEDEVAPYVPPAASAGPIDNLQAKREREAFLNRAFTREQQQAIVMILDRWWSQKMAGIETGKVIEATEHLPKALRDLEARVCEIEKQP